jgi:hypothetical protein
MVLGLRPLGWACLTHCSGLSTGEHEQAAAEVAALQVERWGTRTHIALWLESIQVGTGVNQAVGVAGVLCDLLVEAVRLMMAWCWVLPMIME